MSQNLALDFNTISLDDLAAIQGGLTREQFVNGGGHVGEIATLAGGAAAGAYLGGPGGAALGTAGAEALNRTGAPRSAGEWAAGHVWDAGAAVGRGAQNAWNGARSAFGY
jgi:hypothetical protein